MNICLANIDYRRHMTTEGDQFQEGLRAAGWTLAGPGYDGLQDVPAILDHYQPERVVVHDKRDWDPKSPIAFRKDVGFERLSALKAWAGFKAVVVKDAASSLPYQKAFYDEVGADAAIVYYHPRNVAMHGPWLAGLPMIRTYHSVDVDDLATIPLDGPRRPALVSGATSNAYPLRQRAVRDAQTLGLDVLRHPGYGNRGSRTAAYLRHLAGYKVHLATASMYGFALRKIIESVAVGCKVITDLPVHDELPLIDGALTRVRPTISPQDLQGVITRCVDEWNLEAGLFWADRARAFYDYRSIGARLDREIARAATERAVSA